MNNKYNIKVERLNQIFKNYESMEREIWFEDIKGLEEASIYRATILWVTTLFLCVVIIPIKTFGIIFILIIILFSDIILLYISIITDIIIPDKLKEIFEKAYYVHGYILNESSASVEVIEECFFKPEEADDFLTTLLSGVVLIKRKCFKCQEKMNYVHFYKINISETPMHRLEKIWGTPGFELFCCRCYKKKLLFKKWRKKGSE